MSELQHLIDKMMADALGLTGGAREEILRTVEEHRAAAGSEE